MRESQAKEGDTVLDCATGTGDLAIAFKKVVGETGRVVGSDYNEDMLSFAPVKARQSKLEIEWDIQDAMNLTYADSTFDIASIAFGIRNVDDPLQALRSMARVVKSGGRVVVLEFGTPLWWMKPFFTIYSNVFIPLIGGMVSGDRNAYKYLTRTSAKFPTGESFLVLMKETGRFRDMRVLPLTGGIAYLYIGIVQ